MCSGYKSGAPLLLPGCLKGHPMEQLLDTQRAAEEEAGPTAGAATGRSSREGRWGTVPKFELTALLRHQSQEQRRGRGACCGDALQGRVRGVWGSTEKTSDMTETLSSTSCSHLQGK